MSAELTVAISTVGDRLANLCSEALPVQEEVAYLIIWQGSTEALPPSFRALSDRDDVQLLRLAGPLGVARSRTAAIAAAETPILLFADDDQTFAPEGWRQLLQMFEDESVDFGCARLRTPEGAWRKSYGPEAIRPVRFWNCLKVGTPELALRVAAVRKAGVTFDPDFGAGAAHPVGDEAVFLCDALGKGLRGIHAPIGLGAHAAESSGLAFDARHCNSLILLMRRCFGGFAPVVRVAFALKNVRRFPSWQHWASVVLGRPTAL